MRSVDPGVRDSNLRFGLGAVGGIGGCFSGVVQQGFGGDDGFGSVHSGVVNFAFCDGSIQGISKDIDVNVLDRMATRAGEDPYQLDSSMPQCP